MGCCISQHQIVTVVVSQPVMMIGF